jgi:hypothetical protein
MGALVRTIPLVGQPHDVRDRPERDLVEEVAVGPLRWEAEDNAESVT